jgi:hypothetical protein
LLLAELIACGPVAVLRARLSVNRKQLVDEEHNALGDTLAGALCLKKRLMAL